MRTFYDNKHQTWTFELTWDKADVIAERCERPDSTPENRKTFDLFNMTDAEQAEFFHVQDPLTGRFNRKSAEALVNVMYVLCEEQCKERDMSDKDFGKMLATSAWSQAYTMFMEELVNFIPDPEAQALFRNLLFLAGGTRQAALYEANQTLTKKKTALLAQSTQIVEDQLETAFASATAALAKVAGEHGLTSSSKPAEPSVSPPAGS